ncbi:MAG: bifunctional oligoribonuclease/PAP phosphatase NrnA [Bacteroidetes bacterium]|nr:bifunctional oligoribonuclease/PAP phosphatase NrnA [Bacteroidota bacterium]
MTADFDRLHSIFSDHRRFVITSHVNPDADAIGSEVALALYLKGKGKEVRIINQSITPDHLLFLTELFPVHTYNSDMDRHILDADCFCVVDTNSPKRFSAMAATVARSTAVKVCIDHHLEQEPFADLYVIDTDVPATSELLYRIFAAGTPSLITTPVATALYAGIMTDTGSFKFPKTDAETHLITAELLKRGADPYAVYQQIYESGEINKLHLLGKALERIEVHHRGRVATMTIPRSVFTETNTGEADVDNLTQYVLSIRNVVVGLVFIEQPDGVKVSLRSKGEIDINSIAKQFGGGGHRNASGARLKDITLADAVSALLTSVKDIV